MKNRAIVFALAASLTAAPLAGCQSSGGGIDPVTGATAGGAVAGGLLGGFLGHSALYGVVGALGGALIGNLAARYLTAEDKTAQAQAVSKATDAPVGKNIVWNNPQSGNKGTVTTTAKGKDDGGRQCRTLKSTVTLADGKTETTDSKACKTPSGTWAVV